MPQNLGPSFFDNLLYGIFVGICLVSIIYAAQYGRYWYLLKHKYHQAKFDVYLQANSEDANYTVTCAVKRHSILFTAISPSGTILFNGEFIMNPLNLKFGEGYYHRLRAENDPASFEAYGFMKVLIKNDWTFLVEEQLPLTADSKTSINLAHPAIVWKRI